MRSTYYDQMAKTTFYRGQHLERMSIGKPTSTETMLFPPEKGFQSVVSAATAAKSQHLRPTSTTHATYTAPSQAEVSRLDLPCNTYQTDGLQPVWLTPGGLVLRFFAYFIESIELGDGKTEDRVRRVVMCYYLCDHSISITEPRVTNSGIIQGEFMRRTVVRKIANQSRTFPYDNIANDFYLPQDFRIGGELRLYGRTFYIIDCDAATRTYYLKALGETLVNPRMYPDESIAEINKVDELKDQQLERTRAIDVGKIEATRKFYDLGQKVLRFYASWYDDHPLYPETRHLILHYYLCDDTIEIIEARNRYRERSQGRFSILLSRRKLSREAPSCSRQLNQNDSESYFITDRDLRCGEKINVFSRRLLLIDCDAFTREYYIKTYGVKQEKKDSPLPDATETTAQGQSFHATQEPQAPFASNGQNLSGYPANKNNSSTQEKIAALTSSVTALSKIDDFHIKQLRFRAHFQGLRRGDLNAQRKFVVTFFLEDETIAIFEPRIPNSGILGGRFLDRAPLRKNVEFTPTRHARDKAVSSHYQAPDMFVGAVLTFEFSPFQRLELIEADTQTLNFCENHPETFPFSDSSAVLEYTTELWIDGPREVDLRLEWRQLDKNRTHIVSFEDMNSVMSRAKLLARLNKQQLITLSRKFTQSENNQSQEIFFAYDNFCDAFSAVVKRQSAQEKLEDVSDTMSWKLIKIPCIRQILISAGLNSDYILLSDLLRVVNDQSVILSKAEIDALASKFTALNGGIDIHQLCDFVFRIPTDQPVREIDSNDINCNFEHDNMEDSVLPRKSSFSRQLSTSQPNAQMTALQSACKTVCSNTQQPSQSHVDPRVVSVLQRVFGTRKYQLRKALRDRDDDRKGQLNEDKFMEALITVAPQISDDDSYLLADAFFPTNKSFVNYSLLLDSAFRN